MEQTQVKGKLNRHELSTVSSGAKTQITKDQSETNLRLIRSDLHIPIARSSESLPLNRFTGISSSQQALQPMSNEILEENSDLS